MPRSKPAPPCRWWEHDDYADGRSYFTDCHGPYSPLLGTLGAVAEAVWADESSWCPFCGGEIWYCEENEVVADDQAEHDHRMGVRYGTWM